MLHARQHKEQTQAYIKEIFSGSGRDEIEAEFMV